MLRVVSESTDTCSHRKGGFTCKHMYLFVLKQEARRGTALRGGALLLPTGAKLRRRNCNPAGCRAIPGLGLSRAGPLARTVLQGAPELGVTASHAGVLPQAPPAPSTVPPEQENLPGAPPKLASQDVFGFATVAPGGGRGTSHLHQATSLSHAILPGAAAPAGSRHTLRAPQLRGAGAQGDHDLIFVPLFQQAWKQDMQERYCQQERPPHHLQHLQEQTYPRAPEQVMPFPKKSHATNISPLPSKQIS